MTHATADRAGIVAGEVSCKNAALAAQETRPPSARKLARAVLPNGNILTVCTSAVGMPHEISIILNDGRSILVNEHNVRILGLDNGGFSVITPRAIVVYDSAGNELSVCPNTICSADVMMGSVIFSTTEAEGQDLTQASQPRSQGPTCFHQDGIQAESVNLQTATPLGRPASVFAPL